MIIAHQLGFPIGRAQVWHRFAEWCYMPDSEKSLILLRGQKSAQRGFPRAIGNRETEPLPPISSSILSQIRQTCPKVLGDRFLFFSKLIGGLFANFSPLVVRLHTRL
jgi:hypothetical protein